MNILIITLGYIFLGFCSGAAATNVATRYLSDKDKQTTVLIHIVFWPAVFILNATITFFELIHRKYK